MTKSKEIDYHRYWKELYEKEHKLRQEVENEIVLIKGITVTNSPELRAANTEINGLKNKSSAEWREYATKCMIEIMDNKV